MQKLSCSSCGAALLPKNLVRPGVLRCAYCGTHYRLDDFLGLVPVENRGPVPVYHAPVPSDMTTWSDDRVLMVAILVWVAIFFGLFMLSLVGDAVIWGLGGALGLKLYRWVTSYG